MATRYTELRDKLLNWTNRDPEVFGSTMVAEGATDSQSNAQLYDFLKYAADKAYRTLRIPPLEKVYRVTVDSEAATNSCIGIPSDLTEFISITKIGQSCKIGEDAAVITQRINPIVYNEKIDYRTYRDSYAERTGIHYWTRQRGKILFANMPPQVNYEAIEDNNGVVTVTADVFEIYYYGRLTALNAVYPAGTMVDGNDIGGMEIVNWLRDENERILLFGALSEAFSYLGEDDMQAKYLQMFQQEIDELNREEEMRKSSGGNIQTQYSSFLI